MRQKMEDTIFHNEISWHALPFTTHTELMDVNLFRYGLSISKALDQKYGVHTIGAKMTDVPGHTKGIIPEMARAGIRFMHIGVNAASSVPEVPEMFRWRGEDNRELIIMYNNAYECYTEIPGTDTAVYFAHTNDNMGPQNKEDVLNMYRELEKKYPDAKIEAGTLNDVALAAMQSKNLPIVTSEIGDSWIFGTASDPEKIRRYKALLRRCADLPDEIRKEAYQNLLLVPEHTWGLDEKNHLGTFGTDGKGACQYYKRS